MLCSAQLVTLTDIYPNLQFTLHHGHDDVQELKRLQEDNEVQAKGGGAQVVDEIDTEQLTEQYTIQVSSHEPNWWPCILLAAMISFVDFFPSPTHRSFTGLGHAKS